MSDDLLQEVLDFFIDYTKPNEKGQYPYLSRHVIKHMHESALVWKYGKKDWRKHLKISKGDAGNE